MNGMFSIYIYLYLTMFTSHFGVIFCFCSCLFLAFVFQIDFFIHFIIFYRFLARGLRPTSTTGQHDGIHTGTKQRGTTGNQTGENNEKMRNVTFILGYMDYMWLYGLYMVICCFMGYVGYLWLLSTILYIFFLYVLSPIIFQIFIGSFSRHQSLKEISI